MACYFAVYFWQTSLNACSASAVKAFSGVDSWKYSFLPFSLLYQHATWIAAIATKRQLSHLYCHQQAIPECSCPSSFCSQSNRPVASGWFENGSLQLLACKKDGWTVYTSYRGHRSGKHLWLVDKVCQCHWTDDRRDMLKVLWRVWSRPWIGLAFLMMKVSLWVGIGSCQTAEKLTCCRATGTRTSLTLLSGKLSWTQEHRNQTIVTYAY